MADRDLTCIVGGALYDPRNSIDGQVQDIWIEAGKIVAAPSDPAMRPTRRIDARGLIVMPGGVDMHCHIAGPKVNAARKLCPEMSAPLARTERTHSGTTGPVPSTFATGYLYSGLGYTTAFDAAIPPIAARHAHLELADTPCLDKGFYVLVGNNHYLLQAIRDREPERLKAFLAWLLGAARGYAPKLVNPGGVEAWKGGSNAIVDDIDAPLTHFEVTPRQILTQVAHAANELSLPHPVHIHANNLGMPGNWRTTLATMQALDGLRAHLTHIQFHSYAGGDADETTFGSRVEPLADYINAHPELTVDVGQVLFGDTISLTGDSALSHYLHRIYGGKWFRCDVEMEGGCGVAPIRYRNKSLVHAWQWAIGLEWYLSVNDPWQVVMSTDHPNGGSFLAYPQIIRLLMDRAYRQELLKSCPKSVREGSRLGDMDREYTLGEIAIITRAGPARILGLTQKGHLGVGADADVTIYTPQDDKQAMFELPRMVIKAGETVVDQGEIRSTPSGETLSVRPEFDDQRLPDIRRWFEKNYSVQFENYALVEDELPNIAAGDSQAAI